MTMTLKEFQAEIARARNQKPFITYLVNHDGCRFMHVSEHGRDAMLSKSSEAQSRHGCPDLKGLLSFGEMYDRHTGAGIRLFSI